MDKLREAGVKALWRFAYDRNPGQFSYSADLIVSHIAQLRAVFNRGMDIVYVLQAGWIGAWGEWHSSKNKLENNKTATSLIVEHSLFKLLPADRKITIRYSMDKAQKVLMGAPYGVDDDDDDDEDEDDPLAFGILTAANAKSNTAVARIGFDNDAVMTDPVDCGTYMGGQGAFPPTTDATCFFNDCDTRTARTFGPQESKSSWSRSNLHGPPLQSSFGTPIYDSLHGPMVDPTYSYVQHESAFVPMDGEMDWNSGGGKSKSGCNSGKDWPIKVGAESFAWRARDMHYSTLSIVHGYWVLDGKDQQWSHNETIDSWMGTSLNLTRLYLDKLPVSRHYAASNHTGFEYLRDHLGYRLELQHASWPDAVNLQPGLNASLPFSAMLLNWGFAAPINPRPVQLVILSADLTRILWRSPSLADPTDWQPYIPGDPFFTPLRHKLGGNMTVHFADMPCELPATDCVLPIGLHLPDSRNDQFAAAGVSLAFSIRLANQDVPWLDVGTEGGVNILGELHLSTKPAMAS
jgi:hypothetical protein